MTNSPFSIAPLIQRVKTVVTDPSGCWDTVSADSRDAKSLFKEYAVPMAVLGALASLIGSFVSGVATVVGVGVVLLQFVSAVIMACASGFIMAFIATKVASMVGGSVTLDRAYSWLLHASMVGFVGGLTMVVPFIGALVGFVASIATLYWGWKGIGPMIQVPAEKRVLFFIGTIVGSFIALVLFSLVLGTFIIGTVGVPVAATQP
ncbi:MAG: hypothetical protein RL518_505 [Pseudomonadota bacterium]|jgi:MFS family permease